MLDALARYRTVRLRTASVVAPIAVEHREIALVGGARSVAWHLAHTSWFFERFVLPPAEGVAKAHLDDSPDVAFARREALDERIARALNHDGLDEAALAMLEHGLHHEQHHQELILAVAKLVLAGLPEQPAYRDDLVRDPLPTIAPLGWIDYDRAVVSIGAPHHGFAFAQERPRHAVTVKPFRLATRPIANAEVLAFIGDGGYEDARLWSRDGFATQRRENWRAPLYWFERDGAWWLYTLGGAREIDPAETACHLSYYEAEAIAAWAGARLPTEIEWEHAASSVQRPRDGHWADDDRLHPRAAGGGGLAQMFGDVWEHTSSVYQPYPGSPPPSIASSENVDDSSGNAVPGELVVRGGSCLSARGHVRASYRMSLAPSARWQMSGVRLAHER